MLLLIKGCFFVSAKILIVDDEKNIVDIHKFNLTKEGFTSVEAYDGEQAMKWPTVRSPI